MLAVKTRKVTTMALVALMAFAQAVYAWDACVDPAASAAAAVAGSTMQDCESMNNESSCLAQCTLGSQSSAYADFVVPAMPAEAVLTLPHVHARLSIADAGFGDPPSWSVPEPSLEFCRFLL
ncbi:MAG: hypothetical protein JSU95_15830 [Betaproteobacteria bacterium]|nr:MAG: hypothetical protein JSU95_15830 [Betaproteobacteria bacterium]